jgi:outer membrane receptor protein involved in Fe transport
MAIEWQRIGSWYVNQVNTAQYADAGFAGANGVSVLNIRLGYQYKAIQVFANILNASNELYATAASRGNNASDKTTFTPAAPRSVNAGIMFDIFQINQLWKK